MMGESPKAIPQVFKNTKFPSIDEKIKQMTADWEEALVAHELARSRIAERKKSTFILFEKGQKVWLDTRNMKTTYHKKMAPKWEGLFEIEEVLGPITYRLKLQDTWKIYNVFHAILLKPYQENEMCGKNFPTPPPEIINGEEVCHIPFSSFLCSFILITFRLCDASASIPYSLSCNQQPLSLCPLSSVTSHLLSSVTLISILHPPSLSHHLFHIPSFNSLPLCFILFLFSQHPSITPCLPVPTLST